jgi:hypothetical protein
MKNEIEQQIQDMLSKGLIQHSQSAFSSPVLLVKRGTNLGIFVLIIDT